MSDKLRGAIFNILGDINGLSVLDAFSGSGALAFEAVSRGASRVIAIDSDRQAQQTIAANIKSLNMSEKVKLIKASVNAWLTTSDEMFDIILADPPYDDLQIPLLVRLTARVKNGSLLVLSWPGNVEIPVLDSLTLVSCKGYGDARLVFFRQVH